YFGALETLKLIQSAQGKNVAHIEKLHRLQGDYPLAPEVPPKINLASLVYIAMGFKQTLIPMHDELFHFGVHKLIEDFPELEFDFGFFSTNLGYRYSEDLDQDKASLLISGVLYWISNQTVYRTNMDPQFMKEAARQRLGHHFDGLFRKIAYQVITNWTAEEYKKSKRK
ncbi:hypothetical protein KY335_01950, partial [Candidatus Woesearchaeota archaeon]|nr:hypothetical protein [Candidatus Woesearchaeota archaeon]